MINPFLSEYPGVWQALICVQQASKITKTVEDCGIFLLIRVTGIIGSFISYFK